MPNRARPRCPKCGKAMEPALRKRRGGKTTAPIPDVFWCQDDGKLAKGRRRPTFL